MGFFKNAATEWEKTMTENDLDKMEAQGLDVTAYREKLAARRAQEAVQAKRDKEMWQNPTHLDKLAPYIATPRSMENAVLQESGRESTLARKEQVAPQAYGRTNCVCRYNQCTG